MKTIGRIVETIVAIAAFAAGIAFIFERFEKSSHKPFGVYEKYIKRPLDAFLATGALIVLSPVLLVTAILVRLKLGSPILFTQERPGRDGKIFKLYKFRTMTDKRDESGNLLPDTERMTKFGRILRSLSLDELPELINIIKGEMSIIGPRPLLVKYFQYYTEYENRRHEVRPGLTGLAQINGRNAIRSWERRFQYDVEYVDHVTLEEDLSILLRTIKKVFVSENVVDPGLQDDFDEYRRKQRDGKECNS